MSERVNVSVHVEIDGVSVVDEVYTANNREVAAGNFETWADDIRDAVIEPDAWH